MSLVVCGIGEPGYASLLRKLATALELSGRVKFVDQVEGKEKSRAFWKVDVCIVPFYTENFSMVAAESLAHVIRVIASRGTPWKELVQSDYGLWVENDPASLVQAITEIRNRNLGHMGRNGRQWMQEIFSWEVVAARLHVIYRSLVGEIKD